MSHTPSTQHDEGSDQVTGTAQGTRPWVDLSEAIATGDADVVSQAIKALHGTDIALALSRIEPGEREQLAMLLSPEDAAALLSEVTDTQAVEVLEALPAPRAALVAEQLQSDEMADLLSELPDADAERILKHLPLEDAEQCRQLMEHPRDTAGGMMRTEYVAYPRHYTVGQVVSDLQANRAQYAGYNVQYLYVVDEQGKLVGVLPVRELLFAAKNRPIEQVMRVALHSVHVEATLGELHGFFDEWDFFGVPVVDGEGRLVGVVDQSDVREHEIEEAQAQALASRGIVGGEELRSMPTLTRSRRRLSWLSLNIVLNIIAASVIALYQDTLAAAIALAVFLPMISDMSGCSGNQAVAVSLRELALGLVRPKELLRVLSKEASIGMINGVCLGLLLGGVAACYGYWQQDQSLGYAYLGLVVGVALAVNTLIAVSFGGLLPLMLKRLGLDPALVASPMLTTVTDMCGFFLVLSMATLLL